MPCFGYCCGLYTQPAGMVGARPSRLPYGGRMELNKNKTKLQNMKKLIAAGATLAMLASAAPAFATMNSSTIVISSSNSGTISSDTDASAYTGLNTASGSTGGEGGNGGDVEVDGAGSGNNGGAETGNGGNVGASGAGGYVEPGEATATARSP